MSATIKLKSGITNPPDNILQQRELGVNTNTDELFIGTSSGRAKQIASVPYVQMLLMGYVNSAEILPTSNVCTLELSESFCGFAIIQVTRNTIPFYIYIEEGQAKIQSVVEHKNAGLVSITADNLNLTISSENTFNINMVPFTGNFQAKS